METEQLSGFQECDFNQSFFAKVVTNICENAKYLGHNEVVFSSEEGGLSAIGSRSNDNKTRVTGFRIIDLRYIQPDDNKETTTRVVFKVKVKGSDTAKMIASLMNSLGYVDVIKAYQEKPFDTQIQSELKEIAFFDAEHPAIWRAIRPKTFMTISDVPNDISMVAMEDLRSGSFTHLDTVMDPSSWQRDDVMDAFQGIATFHALYYGNTGNIPENIKNLIDATNVTNPYNDVRARAFFRCLVEKLLENDVDLLGKKAARVLQKSIDNMDEVCGILSGSLTTLIHGDFNVRNVCLRKDAKPNEHRLCVYDWEDLRIMCPQHDAAFFIAHILTTAENDDVIEKWSDYFEMYRCCLLDELIKIGATEEVMETVRNKEQFKRVFDMCVVEMLWNRVGGMIIASKVHPLPFIPKLVKSVCRYLEYLSSVYGFLETKLL